MDRKLQRLAEAIINGRVQELAELDRRTEQAEKDLITATQEAENATATGSLSAFTKAQDKIRFYNEIIKKYSKTRTEQPPAEKAETCRALINEIRADLTATEQATEAKATRLISELHELAAGLETETQIANDLMRQAADAVGRADLYKKYTLDNSELIYLKQQVEHRKSHLKGISKDKDPALHANVPAFTI